MLQSASTYAELVAGFRWHIPPRYNIATSCCDRHARVTPDKVAIIDVDASGAVETLDYGTLQARANRLASSLIDRGLRRGDRIAIMLPQGRALPVAHMAVYKMAAIAVPIASVFGPDALAYRLADSGASAIITNEQGLAKLRAMPAPTSLPDLVVVTDGADGSAQAFEALIEAGRPDFATVDTSAYDPALMIYTSGTTGQPKGALHAHRVVLGHLPGVQMPHEFLPQEGDRIWTPADWAWAGGLLNNLLPALHFGVPIVARRVERFDPEEALHLMASQRVANAFIPPTALRMLRTVHRPKQRYRLHLRTLASGGEALGEETLAWGREAFGLTINEFYGQTECNLIVASCAKIGVSRPGWIGRAVPGHTVAVIRADGTPCEPDEEGEIVVHRPDPVMFLSYWGRPEATDQKFIGDWMKTGDQGLSDADGNIRFIGRDDDVITSSGYRIGPGEIEDCLIKHNAVALAAVVGKPDPLRTEIVKAFVVLKRGWFASDELAADIRDFVRNRLSAHEYPREVAFIEVMPLTATGKIIRRVLREQA
jgi:acetyl-CoA synthetase